MGANQKGRGIIPRPLNFRKFVDVFDTAVVVGIDDRFAVLLYKFGKIYRVLGSDIIGRIVYLHFFKALLGMRFSSATIEIDRNHLIFFHAITPFDHYILRDGRKQATFVVK